MKRVLVPVLVLTLAMVFMFGSANTAQALDKVGVVNMQKVLNDFKEAESINDTLQKEKDALQEKLDAEQEKIRAKKDKAEKQVVKMKDADKKKIADDLNKDLTILQENFQKFSNQLREKQGAAYKKLENQILKAIETVSAAEKLELVVEKGVVFIGGVDITEKVIEKLNGGKTAPKKAATEE